MRSIVLRSTVMAVALATAHVGASQAPEYADVLTSARQALGGDARLNAIRTFHATGDIEVSYDGKAIRSYGSFEIMCDLPDKFVETERRASADAGDGARIDVGTTLPFGGGFSGPGSSSSETTVGFNATKAIYRRPITGYMGVNNRYLGPPSITKAQLDGALKEARRGFVEWTMGLFASTFGVPQPFGQLQVDPVTHLPSRLATLEYLDYRYLNGLQVPFRLRRISSSGIRSETVWSVRAFDYNVSLPSKTFEPTKASK